jgi:Xaa-Pro aminopeptidase
METDDTTKPVPIGFSADKASKVLSNYGIDVLVAATPVNIFYTTGMPTLHVAPNPILYVLSNQFPTMAIIRKDGIEFAATWMVYQSTKRWTWLDEVAGTVSPQQTLEEICKKIEEWGLGAGAIGIESQMPRYQADFLRQRFPQAAFIDADRAFLDMRLLKTGEEIARIKESTRIAEKAIMAVIDTARDGITDIELLKIAKRTVVEEGAEGWDHMTMGLGASDPEAPGVGYTVSPGQFNRIDIGAVYKGYVSDISRQFVVGSIPENGTEHMERMIKVQEFLEANLKPGVKALELYKEAKAYAKSLKKLGMTFITAHSIGLECEEAHIFSPMRQLDIEFEENMVLDLEVWQSFPASNLVGTEDCYRVTASGVERISTLDKGIFVK